jgi:nucleotide-binding universal stress UspA family protein
VFRTIVVGHDGTAAADVALRLAERLAADGALLLLARVVPAEPLLAHALPHGHEPALRDAAVPELEELRPGIKGALRIATRAVTNDSVAHGLVAIAEAEGADLIVVGSDRRRGDYRAHGVLGLRLLRGAPCAVAIAPADADVEIRHIGVAYDGSAEADLALEAAYALARGLRAAVTLYLAVLPDPAGALDGQQVHREARALLDAAAARAPEGVNPETVIATGYAGLAIAERAAGVVDLLVVGSRQQGPVRRVLLGSTSRAIALAVECVLLVTPRGAGAHARARAERDRRPGGADVVVEHLSKRFGGQVTALDDVSLHLRGGEFTLLPAPGRARC